MTTKQEAYTLCNDWFTYGWELEQAGEHEDAAYAYSMAAYYNEVFVGYVKAQDPHYN